MAIIGALDKGGIMTARQLWQLDVGGLGSGSVRNCLRVLREMERDGILVSRHVGVKLFSLREKGLKFGFWEHRLLLIDFLIYRDWFDDSMLEVPIRVDGVEVLKADAGVLIDGKWHFIEVDRRQKLKANKEKIKRYRGLNNVNLWVVCDDVRVNFWKKELNNVDKIIGGKFETGGRSHLYIHATWSS